MTEELNDRPEQPGPTGSRKCRRCRKEKNVSEFRPDKKAANGNRYQRNQCRECESEDWRRAWHAGKKGRRSATVLALNAPSTALPERHQDAIEGQLEEAIKHRMIRYQSDALDALHDLAMMPISENSAQNQVKLLAAKLLAEPLLAPENTGSKEEMNKVLRELNEEFQRNTPRLKLIRERIVEFQQEPPASVEAEKSH
jgi:hypothetical protein